MTFRQPHLTMRRVLPVPQGKGRTRMPDQNPSPRFAYLELSTLFGPDGDLDLIRYLDRFGFRTGETHTPDGVRPGWRSTEMRRGSFPVMVTGHRSGSGLYPQVLHSGPFFSAAAFTTPYLPFTLSRAEEAGLRADPIRYFPDGGMYSNVEGPGGLTYTFLQGGDWGADDRQAGTGALDHIAVVTTKAGHREVIDAHMVLFGEENWHLMPVTTLPSGEAMGSGYVHAGDVRITIVWPAGECRQLAGFRVLNGGDGIQHAALRVDDTPGGIITEVDAARANGIRFRDAPGTYYEYLEQRLGHPVPDLDELRARGILADDDEYVSLKDGPCGIRQIFASPFGVPEHGPFLELIDRSGGGEAFGGRNVRALAESIQLAAQRAAQQMVS